MPTTPGPWLFQGDRVDDSKGLPLCKNVRSWASFNPDDFRLISQAPAMYELLKDIEVVEDGVTTWCPCCGENPPWHSSDCRLAAVLKAVEGE